MRKRDGMKLDIKTALITFVLTTILYGLMAFVLPIGVIGATGAYNWNSGLMWCNDTQSCLHEAGHAMDKRLGFPSQKQDFKKEVNDYLKNNFYILSIRPVDFAGRIALAPGIIVSIPNQFKNYPIYSELYANMYAWASGCKCNMPVDFQKFYQWNN